MFRKQRNSYKSFLVRWMPAQSAPSVCLNLMGTRFDSPTQGLSHRDFSNFGFSGEYRYGSFISFTGMRPS